MKRILFKTCVLLSIGFAIQFLLPSLGQAAQAVDDEGRDVLAPGQIPGAGWLKDLKVIGPYEKPTAENYSPVYKRKTKDGGYEFCRFVKVTSGIVSEFTTGNENQVRADCYPSLAGRPVYAQCSTVGGEAGSTQQVCNEPKAEVLTPDSPLEACKYVRLSAEDNEVNAEVRQAATFEAACEMVRNEDKSLFSFFQVNQAIKNSHFGAASPEIPQSSQKNDVYPLGDTQLNGVHTLADMVVLGDKETVGLLKSARNDLDGLRGCLKKRAEAAEKNVTNIQDAVGAECFKQSEAQMAKYKATIPDYRIAQMLTMTDQSQPGHNDEFGLFQTHAKDTVNYQMVCSGQLICPDDSKLSASASSEEQEKAKQIYATWQQDIEKAWPEQLKKIQQNRGKNQQLTNAQGALEQAHRDFFNQEMQKKHEEVEKQMQKAFQELPFLQVMNTLSPKPQDWVNATQSLIKKNEVAQDTLNTEAATALARIAKYNASMQAYKACQDHPNTDCKHNPHSPDPRQKPSLPDVSDLNKLSVAQGALNMLVKNDPSLCGAATMYLSNVGAKNFKDAVIQGSVIVAVGIGAGVLSYGMASGPAMMATGAVLGTGSLMAASYAVGMAQYYHSAEQANLGSELLSVCLQHHDGDNKVNCDSPGSLERYLSDKSGASPVSFWTSFLPLNGEFALAKSLGIAMAASGYAVKFLSPVLQKEAAALMAKYNVRQGQKEWAKGLAAAYHDGSLLKDMAAANRIAEKAADQLAKELFPDVPGLQRMKFMNDVFAAIKNSTSADGKGLLANLDKNPNDVFDLMRAISRAFKETPHEEGKDALNLGNVAAMIRLLQNPATGLPVAKGQIDALLSSAFAALATGKSPDEALAVLKQFGMDSPEALAGLQTFWGQHLSKVHETVAKAKNDFLAKNHRPMTEEEQNNVLRMAGLDPESKETRDLMVATLKDDLTATKVAEKEAALRQKGITDEAELKRQSQLTAAEQEDIDKQAKQMYCCQGGKCEA